MDFVHLHCHSCYSLLQGADWPETLVRQARKQGMKALALTDTNGLYGAVPFYKAALKHGVKAVFGVELTAVPRGVVPGEETEVSENERAVVLARDMEGFGVLCRLITERQLEAERFDLKQCLHRCLEAKGQHVFVLTSHEEVLEYLMRRGGVTRREQLFIDLAPFADGRARKRLRRLGALSRRWKVRALVTNDVHFSKPHRREVHTVLSAIRLNTTVNSLLPQEIACEGNWLKSTDEMMNSFGGFPRHVFSNTARVAEQCNVEFTLGQPIFPQFPLPHGETAFSYLWKLCFRGAEKRYKPLTQEVINRLTRELRVIEEFGFSPYFLIVWDIARYAREQGIPSVGRGSAANSIVSYVLEITHVDPIALDLFFERFLNPERKSCPDIDLDFCWRRRDQVLDYVYRRYGRDRVAMISTHSTLRARAAVREVAKTLGVPGEEISAFTRHLPHGAAERISHYQQVLPELRDLPLEREPFRSVVRIAQEVDGFPRHLSIHCGGIVVCPFPLTDLVPLQRSAKGLVVTQYDMYPIEELGLLKIDLLGQRGLSVVADSSRAVERNYGKPVDLRDEVVQRDPETIAAIRDGRTMGCFYIESPGMRGLLKKLKVSDFEGLTAASSVIRPGVAESGMMRQYIERCNGREKVSYLHPAMEKVLKRTFGVMIYQEDVIKVAHEVAGLSLGEADVLRRAMSGKGRSRQAMEALQRDFLERAETRGVAEPVAREIWRQIASFAGYAFCKAHSASFAQISFQSAYMKVHYPAEFMAAVLSNQGGFYHTAAYLEEARRMGLTLLLPDINLSEREYTAKDRTIRVGLMQIRELSEKTIQHIFKERRKRLFVSIEDFLRRVVCSADEARQLVRAGAFDCFELPRTELLWRIEVLEALRKRKRAKNGKSKKRGKASRPMPLNAVVQEKLPLHSQTFAAHPTVIVPRMPEMESQQRLKMEREALDLLVSQHPLELYADALAGIELVPARDLPRHEHHFVTLVGWLVTTRRVKTKKGEYMRFLTLEDTTAIFEAVLFPKAYRQNGHIIHSKGPYLVRGRVEGDSGNFVLNTQKLKVLTHS